MLLSSQNTAFLGPVVGNPASYSENHGLEPTVGLFCINLFGGVMFLTQYCAGGKIEKNEMGVACGACGGGERCAQGSGGET